MMNQDTATQISVHFLRKVEDYTHQMREYTDQPAQLVKINDKTFGAENPNLALANSSSFSRPSKNTRSRSQSAQHYAAANMKEIVNVMRQEEMMNGTKLTDTFAPHTCIVVHSPCTRPAHLSVHRCTSNPILMRG
jgi:hypothetical protein